MEHLARAFFRMPPKKQEIVSNITWPQIPDNASPQEQEEIMNSWGRELISKGMSPKDVAALMQLL
jgi:hypothetical protein